MARHLINIPTGGVDQPTLIAMCQSINDKAKVAVLGSENKIRIIDDGNTITAAYQALANQHDSVTPKLQRELARKFEEIDEYRDARVFDDFEYNGLIFNGDRDSIVRFLAKRVDAVEYDEKNPSGPPFTQKWKAGGQQVYLGTQDLINIGYLIALRTETEVFNAGAQEYIIITTCTTPKQVRDYDYVSSWGSIQLP